METVFSVRDFKDCRELKSLGVLKLTLCTLVFFRRRVKTYASGNVIFELNILAP